VKIKCQKIQLRWQWVFTLNGSMIEITTATQQTKLRRLALASQGLLTAAPFGRGVKGTAQAIEHLGYIQLDSISVVERAHHHVLSTRVPGYQPKWSEQLLLRGKVFEYWSHAAALLPMTDFRFSLPYKNAIKSGQNHWFKDPDAKLMQALLERIRNEGPLRSRDVETRRQNNSGWWDWKPAKKALEQLYMQGDLMVCDRTGFQKTYDLTERVLPDGVDTREPDTDEFAAHLLQQQLRCHGLVSLKGLTYLRRNAPLRQAMAEQVNSRFAEQQLTALQLPGGEIYYVETSVWERPMPRLSERLVILSPFDNAAIQRDRLSQLFGFDYQLECYVPAAKRRHGYFSLPLLYRDVFIGRMDCKAHRKTRHLEIKNLHFESHGFSDAAVIDALVDALQGFVRFQDCDTVTVQTVEPSHTKQPLIQALTDHDLSQ